MVAANQQVKSASTSPVWDDHVFAVEDLIDLPYR